MSAPTQRTQAGTATSRLAGARPAERRAVKARLALGGPAGAGKTWTALSIATALAPGGSVLLIDTEANEPDGTAAELYADVYDFTVLPWAPPYDPRDLAATITDAGRNFDVVIIDSATHFWRGEGGTLDIADGRFGGWKTATPAQNDLIMAILRADAHVISCMRAKEQYLVTDKGGKQEVTKMGLGMVQRDDMEYEFQVIAMIDMEHRLDVGKTRCAPLAGRSFPPNHEHEFAAIYATWLAKGIDLARMTDIDAVRNALRAISDLEERNAAIREFRNQFGMTDHLTKTVLPDVWAWIAARRSIAEHPFTSDDDNPRECVVCGTEIVASWHRIDAAPAPTPEGRGVEWGGAHGEDGPPRAPEFDINPDDIAPVNEVAASQGDEPGGDPDAVDVAWREEATSPATLPDTGHEPTPAGDAPGGLPLGDTGPRAASGRRRT